MRQIKFRAWDGKKMVATGTIHDTVRGSYEMWDGDNHEYYPVMQFTGLLDKNGKEIYEGDIVRLMEWVDNPNIFKIHPNLFQVDWSESNAGFEMYSPDKLWGNLQSGEPRTTDMDIDMFKMFADNGDTYEIIGNIYENPEFINPSEGAISPVETD